MRGQAARRPSPRAALAHAAATHRQSAAGQLRELPREEMGERAQRRFAELDEMLQAQGHDMRLAKFVLPDGREAILAVPIERELGADEIERRCVEELARLDRIFRRRGVH